jgi:alanyl-tRNA synthetase
LWLKNQSREKEQLKNRIGDWSHLTEKVTKAKKMSEEGVTKVTEEMANATVGGAEEKEALEWPVDRVRSSFIDFFVKKHGHVFWPSSPCVPHDDPTLLFANAGMNQYKPLFLGTVDPNLEMASLKRATNAQKCIRAGGKHNDLDDVGKDVYHHTFFEMLGNWSFGDYFKKEAIDLAFQCLTVEFKLDPERLYASYFGGDENSPVDTEAKELWLKHLPEERVLPFNAAENFWEMGAVGPCGPCTEIHYDRIGGRDASALVNMDDPNVLEIWNNVFIQYNREPDGSLRALPHQHVDTGMGLERLTSILQNKMSNYDTDIFMPLFDAIHSIITAQGIKDLPRYEGKVGADDKDGVDMAYRVIADHIRTLSFSIADGAVPSNDGRGYVLRRVLRRAVRYGRSSLQANIGFFSQLVPVVVKNFGDFYPELKEKETLITSIISEEEESFGKTLDKGLKKFDQMADKCKESGSTVFSGQDAHALYASMGFPVDLTELMAEERGLTLDKDGFEALMKHEHDLSENARIEKQLKASGGIDMSLEAEQTNYLNEQNISVTDDMAKYTRTTEYEAQILELYVGRNATDKYGFTDAVDAANVVGFPVGVVLNQTSYYAESGGQVADSGTIIVTGSGAALRVTNVQVYAGYIVHTGTLVSGQLSVGDQVKLNVDYSRRLKIESNHTMTHILNFALRQVLVTEATDESALVQSLDQRGSLVDESKLRFDFSWSGPLTEEQLVKVEQLCVDRVKLALPVESLVAKLDEAQQISSLRAVFGETYPDPVRVVSVATAPLEKILADPASEQWKDFSVEFCGGTHLTNTSQAEEFVLLNEEGIAKGVRRIIAVTMSEAREALMAEKALTDRLKAAESMDKKDLEQEIKALTAELNEASISAAAKIKMRGQLADFSKAVVAWKKQQSAKITEEVVATAVEAAKAAEGLKAVCRYDFGLDGKLAKSVMAAFGKQVSDKAFLMVTADEGSDRFMVFAFAPKGCKGVDCKAWVAAATAGTEAKGGGKKDSAQSTVPGCSNIDKVLEQARAFSP